MITSDTTGCTWAEQARSCDSEGLAILGSAASVPSPEGRVVHFDVHEWDPDALQIGGYVYCVVTGNAGRPPENPNAFVFIGLEDLARLTISHKVDGEQSRCYHQIKSDGKPRLKSATA